MGPARAPVEGLVAEAARAVMTALTDGGVAVKLGPPPDGPASSADAGLLHVWPLALMPDRITAPGPDTVRLRVRFLITADTAPARLPLLDRALLVAVADPYLGLVLDPVPTETWIALRVLPRVAVVVEVLVHVPRPAERPVRVRGPLRVDGSAIGTLRGRVVGPGAVPVPGAVVRAVDVGVSTRTGRDGEFALDGVPGEGAIRLLISARGVQLSTQVPADAPEPPVLSLRFEEV